MKWKLYFTSREQQTRSGESSLWTKFLTFVPHARGCDVQSGDRLELFVP